MARNFIDRCFEAVAPVHAVRRSAARTALSPLACAMTENPASCAMAIMVRISLSSSGCPVMTP